MPQTITETNAIMEPTDPKKSKESKETSQQFLERLNASSDVEIVEELASRFFSITKIALFIGMNPEKLRGIVMYDEGNELSRAYWKGKMKTEIVLRFDTLNFATHGSPQAAAEMKEYLSEQQIEEYA